MVWLELPKIGDKVQVIQHNASTLETKFTDVRMRSIVILMRHVSDIGADGRSIDYRSESWVVFPPYLPLRYGEVSSGLYKLDPDGQTGTLVDYVFESGEKIDNLKAEGSKTVTESGYYFTEGLHLFYAPAGYTPVHRSHVHKRMQSMYRREKNFHTFLLGPKVAESVNIAGLLVSVTGSLLSIQVKVDWRKIKHEC